MNRIIRVVLFTMVCSFLFVGCTGSSITFNRESGFAKTMENVSAPSKPTVKKSSGLMIYQDNSKSSSSSGQSNMNFDLNLKF